ncbi:MAG: hypothetical protein GXY36_13425 [Chloroflexi bacterium]|nr:hypothetical protein [Chloroflexota bacterium]
MTRHTRRVIAICAALALAGGVIFYAALAQGIGVTTDPARFIDAARSLAAGQGLVLRSTGEAEPLTHHPPFYPALLALIAHVGGIEVLAAARGLHAALLGLNALGVGLAVQHLAPRSRWLPPLGVFFTLGSITLLRLHSLALSEPLFVLLGLGGLALLAVYLDSGGRGWLIGAAVAVGLAALTRYAGAAAVLAGALAIVAWGRGTLQRRVMIAAGWAGSALLPLAIWTARNLHTAGSAADRRLALHPVGLDHLRDGWAAVSGWALPWIRAEDVRGVALVVVVAGLILWGRGHAGGNIGRGPVLARVLALFGPVYLGFLLVTISLVDAETPLDERLLAPIYVAGLVIALWIAGRGRRGLVALIAAAYAANMIVLAAGFLDHISREGQGYTGRAWQESALMAQIEALPPDTLIYSNGPDAIYFLTGRAAWRIPAERQAGTLEPNPDYAAEVAQMGARLAAEGGVMAYFETIDWRWYLPAAAELTARLPLRAAITVPDGALYRLAESEATQSNGAICSKMTAARLCSQSDALNTISTGGET